MGGFSTHERGGGVWGPRDGAETSSKAIKVKQGYIRQRDALNRTREITVIIDIGKGYVMNIADGFGRGEGDEEEEEWAEELQEFSCWRRCTHHPEEDVRESSSLIQEKENGKYKIISQN